MLTDIYPALPKYAEMLHHFFFGKRDTTEKDINEIFLTLWRRMENYNEKFPTISCRHYRQYRANYFSCLSYTAGMGKWGEYEDGDIILLKELLLEMYAHYYSINMVTPFSRIANSLKDAMIDILSLEVCEGIKKDISIGVAIQNFTMVEIKQIEKDAIEIRDEEEKEIFCIRQKGGVKDEMNKIFNKISNTINQIVSALPSPLKPLVLNYTPRNKFSSSISSSIPSIVLPIKKQNSRFEAISRSSDSSSSDGKRPKFVYRNEERIRTSHT